MMPKATDSKILGEGEGTSPRHDPAELAARLACLDLDAETLEMIMAALTTDVCDRVNQR